MSELTRKQLRDELVTDYFPDRPIGLVVAVGLVLLLKYVNMIRDNPGTAPRVSALQLLRQVRAELQDIGGQPRD